MDNTIQIPESKSSTLEKFGLFYLNQFRKKDLKHNVFDISDEELNKRMDKIELKGIILSSIIGIVCVFPTVWVAVHFANADFITYWSWFLGVTIVSVAIEFYILFIIALKTVFEVSELINMHATQKDFLKDGVFSVQHILARTALELPDPELKIVGIDPFEKISKKNLFILGLLYKAKIVVTNFILKYGLKFTVGETIFGTSILYEAVPVEAFWNSVVIKRVVHETRLRLFGFALANHIADSLIHEKLIQQLSPEAKIGCMCAIGNAVVMAKSYHPNMIILLLQFQQLLKINEEHKFDDWNLFLETLNKVNEKERNFLRSLFTIAAAFDGKLSNLEEENLRSAYGNDYALYYPRVMLLSEHLRNGKLNAALALCDLDLPKDNHLILT
jgi:hypothetical protein